MTRILGIDLGTRTGWAIKANDNIASGYADFKVTRGEGGGMRFVKFRNWLNSLDEPTLVIYEMVMRHIGTDAAHVYGGLLALLTAWCEENNIPYHGIGVSQVKKMWTGKGNAKKEAMIEEAQRRGFDVTENNQADAIAILICGMEQLAH